MITYFIYNYIHLKICSCFTTPNMASSQSFSTLPDHLLYKNRLQEHAQKSGLPFPLYQTINEGFPHAPKFRSTVVIDGATYTSNLTFSHRKSAEQDVAKQALDSIEKKIKAAPPNTHIEDPMGYKSILHEFAIKTNRKIPSYRTRTEGGLGPVFVSSVLFDSKVYTGQVSGSRKVAEQLAARAAVRELLVSDMGNLLHEIVKSKGKLPSASPSVNDLSITECILPIDFQPETPSKQPRNIPEYITNPNTSERVMSPISEEKRITETQTWETGKGFNECGRMMSSNREGKNMVVETQNAESKKKVNSSCARTTTSQPAGAKRASATQNAESEKKVISPCARTTGQHAGAKRATETQNVEFKKKVNNSCARTTSQHTGVKRANETQNAEFKKKVNNSCTRMTGQTAEGKCKIQTQNQKQRIGFNWAGNMTSPTSEGKRKMEAPPPSLEHKSRFNSLGIMVGPTNMEGKRKIQTLNPERKKVNSSGSRMISPNKMEGTTKIQCQKFEAKRKFY